MRAKANEGRAVLDVVQSYTRARRLLLAYDEDQLAEKPTHPRKPTSELSLADAHSIAVLTMASQAVRNAGATKNALAAVMNVSAALILAFSPDARFRAGALLCAGSIGGGLIGSWMLHKVNEKVLRVMIVIIGTLLTIALFAGY